jgi:DNA-binding PadR family transcriptional regulator
MSDPLREPTFLILAALAPQPLHGYGIIGEVAALSGERLSLRPGTLYGALDRLADEGLVEPDRQEVVDGRLRRYYRLTEAGAGLLEAEAQRLRHNADTAQQRLARRRERAAPARPRTAPGSGRPRMAPRPAGGAASAGGVAPAGGVA